MVKCQVPPVSYLVMAIPSRIPAIPAHENIRAFGGLCISLHTSESKLAKFKTALDFLRAAACNALRVLAIVEACLSLSVRPSHSAIKTLQARIKRAKSELACKTN